MPIVHPSSRYAPTLLLLALAGGMVPAPLPKPANSGDQRNPVLVELFTSEGCSSCPPADAALARLIDQQPVRGVEIIALSEHVDYWNGLGWSDPFSDKRFTARQREYARAFGRSGVYTPQMVVDGRTGFVGSDMNEAIQTASQAGREAKTPILLTRAGETADGVTLGIQVERVTTLPRDDAADIYLAVTESNLSSDVARGENRGNRLTHAAVVRRMKVIGRSTAESAFGTSLTIPIAREWKRADVRAVVFAQARKSRHILGASSIPLLK